MIPVDQVAISPIKIIIHPIAKRITDSEGYVGCAVRFVIINLVWLVNRHIHLLRVRRVNFNIAVVCGHLLLRCGLQIAELGSSRTQSLDGSHHCWLLIKKSLPEFCCLTQIGIHPLQHIRVSRYRLDAWIPSLLVELIRVSAAYDITVGQNDLCWKGGGRKYLGNQWVGIKRDGTQNLVKLRVGKSLIGWCRGRDRYLR